MDPHFVPQYLVVIWIEDAPGYDLERSGRASALVDDQPHLCIGAGTYLLSDSVHVSHVISVVEYEVTRAYLHSIDLLVKFVSWVFVLAYYFTIFLKFQKFNWIVLFQI